MIHRNSTIAVLTGDLVSSTELGRDAISRAFAALEDMAAQMKVVQSGPLHLTRHRGDGWQAVLTRPPLFLRTALAFRAALKAADDRFDTYIGIAEGPGPPDLAADLNTETARVFIESGDRLDALKLSAHSRLHWAHHARGARDAALTLADHVSQGWTQAQAAAVVEMIRTDKETSFTQVANRLGKSRQAVTKSLDGAGYDFVQTALYQIEAGDRRDD
ncbi:MAG: MarR family transcriptional regulator [Alphaproteobacteria bacterium]|nr:MarR family transcriptional regulator [Alphaproteobacteria bacterium]